MKGYMIWQEDEAKGKEEGKTEEKDSFSELIDPIYELPSEETAKLGYEWILNDEPSGGDEYHRGLEGFRGYSIRRQEGNTLFAHHDDSPLQSHIDFLGTSYGESRSVVPHFTRAFDFEKALFEVGEVRPNLGGQTPHWVGMPQISLQKFSAGSLQAIRLPRGSSLLEALPSASSQSFVDVGVSANFENRPPSPPSFTVLSIEESVETGPTRYSIANDGLNPWGLIDDEEYDEFSISEEEEGEEETTSVSSTGNECTQAKNRTQSDIIGHPPNLDAPRCIPPGHPRMHDGIQEGFPYNAPQYPVYHQGVPHDVFPPPTASYPPRIIPPKPRDQALIEEAISQQISILGNELQSAYEQLERSEIEKRRLIQQLSYLRLMELELSELHAINRIIEADVPAEEDIEILDRIIGKIKGPRLAFPAS